MLRASGKTASATLVRQNKFHFTVIILLDYIFLSFHVFAYMYLKIDFGNKYLSYPILSGVIDQHLFVPDKNAILNDLILRFDCKYIMII